MQKTETKLKKNLFEKIKINNIYNILYFLDFFTITEISFINKFFKKISHKKFTKRIKMITVSIKIYKKNIKFDFAQDFQYLLSNNSLIIIKEIKPLILREISDYFFKFPILKYYINKLPKRQFKTISLKNLNLGKKSIKYLSYYIENNSEIEILNLSKNKLTENILSPLSNLTKTAMNLHTLKLNHCTIDFTTIANFHKILHLNSSIVNLYLRHSNLDDDMITSLKSLNNLKYLNLGGNKISTNGLEHILKSSNRLEILNLENNHLNSTSALFLAKFLTNSDCRIKELYIGDNYITTSGIRCIFLSLNLNPKSELKIFSINKNICENFGNLLLNKTNLKTLEVAGFKFDQIQLTNLLNSLQTNSITCLNLNGNSCFMNEKIAQLFFEELKDNRTILKLDLDNCYISLGKFCIFLLEYFKNEKSTINKLSLAWNSLFNIDSSILCEIIYQNKLKYLNLSNNELHIWHEEKFKNFAIALAENSSIENLNLNNNHLGKYLSVLFENIQFNNSLIELNLENNKMDHISNFKSFKKFLKTNSCLKVISLSNNNLTQIFLKEILEELIANQSILKYDFSKNYISMNGIAEIVSYLICNKRSLDKLIILKSEYLNSSIMNEDIENLRLNKDMFENIII